MQVVDATTVRLSETERELFGAQQNIQPVYNLDCGRVLDRVAIELSVVASAVQNHIRTQGTSFAVLMLAPEYRRADERFELAVTVASEILMLEVDEVLREEAVQ
ncbi:hypothetical protein EYC59_02665 [Candidatus Saccharibacteria bacterium]|nr:MAG: hypothetical protein EYC59_02665 [Candidatus Saccharibacteria bacterium]